jgi:hypothetical protein
MSKNELIRLLFSFGLVPLGALMISLHSDTPTGTLVSHIGFALIVAGVLSTFHETVLRRFEHFDLADEIATRVEGRLRTTPLHATGIRLIAPVRKGMDRYYEWAIRTSQDDVFLAGRSVLHRLHKDFTARNLGTAAEVIVRRLLQGAKIKILLIDPRSELVPRLASEEGQTSRRLLSDIALSLGVCIEVNRLLTTQRLPPSAELEICAFDEIPYFAYHRVGDEVIVGFYFSSAVGHQSAAYEVIDQRTKDFFADHFLSIFSRASTSTRLIRVIHHSGIPEWNDSLFAKLREPIVQELGEAETEKLMDAARGDA